MIGKVIDLWLNECVSVAAQYQKQGTALASLLATRIATANPNDPNDPMNVMNLISAASAPAMPSNA